MHLNTQTKRNRAARYLNIRYLLGVLVLSAFFLRSLVPDGYMPDTSGHARHGGLVSMVICTGMGPATVMVPDSAVPDSAPQKAPMQHHVPCPFAGAFAHGVPAAVAVPPAVLFNADHLSIAAIPAVHTGRFDVYLAQGPPVIA